MRTIIVGLGVQGCKRRHFAHADLIATVDPVNLEADHRAIEDVPLASYEAAIVCAPDAAKFELLSYCLENGKHVLVEKPLWARSAADIEHLQQRARARKVVCTTAYNHRFEPHYVRMRELITSGVLGEIYSARMFYGNGTARLVRNSAWRDKGAGVLPDLGSHLLDTCRVWFGDIADAFHVVSANCFENRAPDHVVISSETGRPRIELEMTLLMWRNHFTCDILGEHGTAHIQSLCKWGPATFTHRRRKLPSGPPSEESVTLAEEDPTWALEYEHFKKLCAARVETDLSNDVWIYTALTKLGRDAVQVAGRKP